MKRKGFTLIELLIVVAIIAILALIAVPNFLEAQTRAKVGRVQADMRSLATAMEAYRVDWNSVPYWDSNVYATDEATARFNWLPGHLWWALTTPVAYITSAFRDPFINRAQLPGQGSQDSGALLDPFLQVGTGYLGPDSATAARTHWFAVSFGPDFSDETSSMSRYPYTGTACPYDPTNGTVSRGDVYRHGDRAPTNFLSNLDYTGGGAGTQGGFNPWW